MSSPRARRSELATPASSERMCEKAADVRRRPRVPRPRGRLRARWPRRAPAPSRSAALTGQDWGRTVRAVRVNGLDTPWCHGDIIEVVTGAREALDVLIVPKARSARDVWWVDVLLTQLETKLGLRKRIGLEVLIEESEGLANAVEIARASDRLEAIIFGAGDLSASQRARVDGNFDPVSEYPGDFWHFARFQVVTAARAAGIDAIDAPYPAYQDPDGYRRSAVHASLLGFDGKWAIHPIQIPIANEVFSPTEAEIADARGVHRDLPRGPRPRASAPSGATAGWSTPPTCAWPRTRCTRPRSPATSGAAPGPPRSRRSCRLTTARRPSRDERRPGSGGLRLERDGVIAWCVIDRPAARNAFTPAMYYGLKRAVRLVNTDPDLGALIITGTGDVFAPGGDLGGREEPGDRLPDGLGHEILPFLADPRQPGAR